MTEILSITNGTDEVTLIGTNSTFRVIRTSGYAPGVATIRPNWHEPALSDGRQLKSFQLNNIQDGFKLFMKSSIDQDTAAGELRSLIHLLMQAISYRPTDWASTPVYLKRKADAASNTEYALIEGFNLPGIGNPFSFLFKQLKMNGLNLTLEMASWSDNPPGSQTAVPIGVVHSFNSNTYGNITAAGAADHTTADEVFISPAYSPSNITNVHIGTGSNLLNSSLPYATIGATGSTHFGVDTSVSKAGTFFNLIFDIGLAAAGTFTLAWEYWNGSTWSGLTVIRDNTNSFANTGVNAISFLPPVDWIEVSPGGSLPTGWWIRCRVASGSLSTQPRQQNRKIYTCRWPHADLLTANITGDLPALAKITLINKSDEGSFPGTGYGSSFFVGTRSLSRGSSFISQLNISDEHQPSGITITNHSGSASFADDPDGPTGREWSVSTTSAGLHIVSLLLDRTIANHYTGRFRMFLIPNDTNFISPEYWFAKVQVNINSSSGYLSGTTVYDSDYINMGTREYTPLDFGELHIPSTPGTNLKDIRFIITCRFYNSTASPMICQLGRLVLIPTDESAVFVSGDNSTVDIVNETNYLEIDSTQGKSLVTAQLKSISNDDLITNWAVSSNGPLLVQANADQRLHILPIYYSITDGGNIVPPYTLYSIQLAARRRYMTMRGDS